MRLIILCLVAAAVVASEIPSRDQEPDPSETRPFRMPDMIRKVCQSMKTLLEHKKTMGYQVRDSTQLSELFIEDFDTNSDRCISGNEIRDVAANFRGNLAGFRTLFEHILDENRSGCVEAEEMSALVMDCMKSAAGWRESQRGYEDEETVRMERIMEQTQPIEEDYIMGEGEEEEGTEEEPELTEENSEDRRAIMEEIKASSKIEETGLGEAVKEMICSLFRREHTDTRFAMEKVLEALGITDNTGFSYEDMFEFIGQVGIGRDEVDDLSTMIDENNDMSVSVEELMTALDGCPIPVYEDIPIVNTRPMIHIDDVPCPTQANVFKEFRVRAMKFIGNRQIEFEGAPTAAREFYKSIAGDIEDTISPTDLDIPLSCVEQCWEGIDSNQDGFLDLMEFERLALDVFEEFLPRPTRKNNVARINLDKSREVNFANIPRESLDLLANTAGRLFGELGLDVPEGDMNAVVGYLVKDSGVKAFLDKIHSNPKEVSEEESSVLADTIAPILYQLQ